MADATTLAVSFDFDNTLLLSEACKHSTMRELCARYPHVKFLVTVLARENQHELCVLARKFGNLHVYGCWWFCNNPSIIEQTTRMRLEMLGTAFTCQHSDARVLDQLIYKWAHSREVSAPACREKLHSGAPKRHPSRATRTPRSDPRATV